MKIRGRELRPIRHRTTATILIGTDEKGEKIEEKITIVYRGLSQASEGESSRWVKNLFEQKMKILIDQKIKDLTEEDKKGLEGEKLEEFIKEFSARQRQNLTRQVDMLSTLTYFILELPEFTETDPDTKEEVRIPLLKDDGLPNGRCYDLLEPIDITQTARMLKAIGSDMAPNEKESAS